MPGPVWRRPAIQLAVALAAAALAFGASLGSLLSGLLTHPALTAACLVLAVSLLGGGIRALRPPALEPDIHDRYLDTILGLGLLGLATGSMQLLPRWLSIFFWSWRLDLAAMPLFVAGAIALLGGSRVLWQFRLPIALLLLAWPLPYVAVTGTGLPPASVAATVLATAGLLVAYRRTRSVARRAPHRTSAGSRRPVGGGILSVACVALAAVLAALGDQGIASAGRLLGPDGQPRLVTAGSAPAVGGLSPAAVQDPPGLPVLAPPAASTTVYARSTKSLAPTGVVPPGAVVVDRVRAADGRDLSTLPSTLALQQGYRVERTGQVDLGSGLYGSLEVYRARDAHTRVVLVWWDWPLRAGDMVLRERVLVQRLDVATSGPGDSDPLLAFSRDLIRVLGQAPGR